MDLTNQNELFAQVIQKCWKDSDFKQKLVNRPVETMEEFSGKKLRFPTGKTLVVRDQTDENTVYINIPSVNVVTGSTELTEEQMELVSGGGCLPGEEVLDIITCPYPVGPKYPFNKVWDPNGNIGSE